MTGFNLHTNNIFSGGLTAAKGISPIISSVRAEEAAAVFFRNSSDSSSFSAARGSSVSAIRAFERVEASGARIGESGIGGRSSGSGKGSSVC